MARVIRFHAHGGPEVLGIEDLHVRPPGPRQVQIRVKALGLNRAEALFRQGAYIERPCFPSGLGLEASGVVEAIGEDVVALMPGDAVSVIPPTSMRKWTTYGEVINLPADLVVKHPPSLDWNQAASVWMAYLTSYGALIDLAGLRKEDFVVVTAASSSVGLAAIQISNLIGATPIAVTRTSRKKEALLALGAAHVVVLEEEDLEVRLRDIAGPHGVRVVFDPIGGPIFEPLAVSMSKGGMLIEYGGLSTKPTPFPLFQVLSKSLTLRGYLVHELLTDPARLAEARSFILHGLQTRGLKPVIAKTFTFDQIVQAHHFLETNEQLGKIVVTL
jgi:NADPH:quinone reductase-like Zn-dependent oxidoreductase